MIFYALCLFSYVLPVAAVRAVKAPLISPTTFAVVFYFTQFGPQALVHGFLRYATNPSALHDQRFLMAISIANVALALGISVAWPFFKIRAGNPIGTYSDPLVRSTRGAMALIVLAALYGLLFVAADGPGIPRLREHLVFLFQDSSFSYTEIRRVLFADTLVAQMQELTRQSTTALFLAFIAVLFARAKGGLRLTLAATGLFVFATAALQLNKFPILYVSVLMALSVYVFKTRRLELSVKGWTAVAIAIPLLLAVLYGLYMVQYAEQIRTGVLTPDRFAAMIFYRPFMAESDGLRLWFEEFPDRTPFLGIRNINLLASLFGLDFFDVTRHIPRVYIHNDLTTFQAGFIGSGYASFGYIGIAAYGVIVGAISVAATALIVYIREIDVKAVFCAVLCVNMYFLFSRELATALLSGGIGPVLAIGFLYAHLRGDKSRRAPRSYRVSKAHDC